MKEPLDTGIIQILLVVAFIIPVVFFVLTQQRILELIRPANRRMSPGMVWLQFIPFLGLVWQFIVVIRISDSIRDELNTPVDDSIFADEAFSSEARPTLNAGISYAAIFCISFLMPLTIRGLIALAGLVVWIVYWVQLARYKKRLKERSMLSNHSS